MSKIKVKRRKKSETFNKYIYIFGCRKDITNLILLMKKQLKYDACYK